MFRWRRSCGRRLARPLSPPRVSNIKVGAMRIELTCTPNRQSPSYPNAQRRFAKRCFRYGRPYRRGKSPIVDWPLRLRETSAPLTSRSPGIATLGPSCTPSRQLGSCIKGHPTRVWFGHLSCKKRCSLNRQLDGQRRRWESNPLRPPLQPVAVPSCSSVF